MRAPGRGAGNTRKISVEFVSWRVAPPAPSKRGLTSRRAGLSDLIAANGMGKPLPVEVVTRACQEDAAGCRMRRHGQTVDSLQAIDCYDVVPE
jgi:hypothetical protein